MTALQLEQIQGNILVGYTYPLVAHLFAPVTGDNLKSCKNFLAAVKVTSAAPWNTKPGYAINVALSYAALEQLTGDPEGRIRESFPAFAAGMRLRAKQLRDPDIGAWSKRHLWVSVHARDEEHLKKGIGEVRALGLSFDDKPLRGQAIARDDHWYEHFGFRDDIANPIVEGAPPYGAKRPLSGNGKRDKSGNWVPLKPGEFVLGYEKEPDPTGSASVAIPPLFRNGTFAVFRDLEQDVPGFRNYLNEQARHTGLGPSDLAARIIGRREDGTPLIGAREPNDFDFAGDAKGLKCPLGAHIRRANHRDPNPDEGGRHRLIRRGRPYGRPVDSNGAAAQADSSPRGLYFVGINASIEDQFEFIQRRWINDRVSTDGDIDPLVGVSADRMFVIEGRTPPLTLVGMPDFVTFRGGEYYFVPSLDAIRALSRGGTPADSRRQS